MKLVALTLLALVALAGVIAWTVWRADTAPVTAPLTAVQDGQQHLHAQLQETIQHENEVEKNIWNSMDQLVKLIQWHQRRIDRLSGNSEAAEILAYDRDSITRIQSRINQLAAQEKAKEAEETE
jgi:TolA-binding protein